MKISHLVLFSVAVLAVIAAVSIMLGGKPKPPLAPVSGSMPAAAAPVQARLAAASQLSPAVQTFSARPEPAAPEKSVDSGRNAPATNEQPNARQQPGAPGSPGARSKKPIQDPTARVALAFVGLDPEAEAYWATAINNPNLPANERKDLIEDLNEDGLSDPKSPGPQDMPIILSRILLIEELAPYSMDEVNAAAFLEAYKDLAGLLNGIPPR
jgi:hypothetical protein